MNEEIEKISRKLAQGRQYRSVTSMSLADMGGRTFQSFKPDRFLDPLSGYRMPEGYC